MKPTLALLIVMASIASGGRADAHHRWSEVYKEGTQISIEGDVTKVEYRNPHSFVHVIVRDGRDDTQKWIVEWRGARQLSSGGVTRATLKAGQHVIVTGRPGLVRADNRLRLRTIVRPRDGFRWSGR
jgi:hypothetical protein